MPKKIAQQDRKTSPVLITMLPLAVSKQVERMAKQEAVSKSEIGRRAITQYFEKESAPARTSTSGASPGRVT